MEKAKTSVATQKNCFVIGPIGTEGSEIRKLADMILNGVVKEVLLKEPFNFEVHRADEEASPGMINDRIINSIIHSDLVIADLTGLNPNVFYELGIRHSTQLPTVHIASHLTKLPFDNAGHSTIFIDTSDWDSILRGRARLSKAVEAINNHNYKVSNPITQANATFEMRNSKDPKDILISDLSDKLNNLDRKIDSITSDGEFSSSKGKIVYYAIGSKSRDQFMIDMGDKIQKFADVMIGRGQVPSSVRRGVVEFAKMNGIHNSFDVEGEDLSLQLSDGALIIKCTR